MARAGSEHAYRADIDGLRAVAVIPVVLYHFGVAGFSGGFVGVDVFFVISGYLITRLIAAELRHGGFDFIHFYERRVRRLFPTLAIVLATTFVVSLYVLTPRDFETFSKSVVYALIFGANFFFDSQGDYFAPALELSPLLHTWSLAVEEQFYVVWPVVLFLGYRYLPRRPLLVAIALLLLASFYANITLVDTKPDAAFYRPHPRAWELLVGCLLALGAPRLPAALAHAMGLAGLALILGAVVLFSHETQFPGFAAAVPVLGAALVIWSSAGAPSLAGRVLALRPLVFVGLVSYAWYLWHWPMVSLFRYHFERDPSAPEIVALIVASFALAVLCWKFVETPVRRGSLLKAPVRAFAAAAATSAVLMTAALAGYATQGFMGRFPDSIKELARKPLADSLEDSDCRDDAPGTDPDNVICRLWEGAGPRRILLWGDSHARGLRTVLRDFGKSGDFSVSHAGAPACPPLIGTGRAGRREDKCAQVNAAVGRIIAGGAFTDIILVARWNMYVDDTSDDWRAQKFLRDSESEAPSSEENRRVMTRGFQRTVELAERAGVRLWVVLETPFVGFDTPNRLARAIMRGNHPDTVYGIDVATERRRSAFVRQILASMPVRVLDLAPSFCDAQKCLAVAGGKPLYFDDNHLSIYGTARIAPALAEFLARAPKSP